MTIADAFNRIAVNQGGQPDTTGTIAGAIDAVCDAVAGEDVPERATIEESVELLGEYIGGGGGSPEPLNVTANGVYIAEVGYSPVTVNVTPTRYGNPHTIRVTGVTTSTQLVNLTVYDPGKTGRTNAVAGFTITYQGKKYIDVAGGMDVEVFTENCTLRSITHSGAAVPYTTVGTNTYRFITETAAALNEYLITVGS